MLDVGLHALVVVVGRARTAGESTAIDVGAGAALIGATDADRTMSRGRSATFEAAVEVVTRDGGDIANGNGPVQ